MSTAREFRSEHQEYLCSVDDNGRSKTVHFTSDTPEHVLDEARAVAISERARDEGGLEQVALTDAERRELDFSRDGVNVPKARYLKGLGEEYGLDAFQHVDLAEIDAVSDARPILERANQSTGQGGQRAAAADEAAERRDREMRANAEGQQAEGCDHARGHCEHGDPDACEFLTEACGYDTEEVADLMSEPERATPSDRSDRELAADGGAASDSEPLSGPQLGAVKRAWGGYHGAIDGVREALDQLTEEYRLAQRAAKAVNGIRAEAGQEPIHFSALEEANAELLDFVRVAAELCTECHADHESHSHAVTTGDTEDLRAFVEQGASETPVGVQDGIGEPTPAAGPAEQVDDTGDRSAPSEGEASDEQAEFSVEKQAGLGGKPADTGEQKQVTLTGDDEGTDSAALPDAWSEGTGQSLYVAGPLAVEYEPSGGRIDLYLRRDDGVEYRLAKGLRSAEAVTTVADSFVERVAPPDVSFKSDDRTVPQAAAEAKREVQQTASGGLAEFGA
jgi:hypothetical protein